MNTGINLGIPFLEWEWYTDSNVVHLFIHLLINANEEPRRWRDISIERGQVLVSRFKLSMATGIPEQALRTALEKLKQTGELTSKSTSKFTILTICNYDNYKGVNFSTNQQTNQQLTSNQPASHQQTNQHINQQETVVCASKTDDSDAEIFRPTSTSTSTSTSNEHPIKEKEKEKEKEEKEKEEKEKEEKEKVTQKEKEEKEKEEKEKEEKEKEKETTKSASENFSIRQKISETEVSALDIDFGNEKKENENHEPKNEKKETPPPVALTPSPLKPVRKPKPQPEALVFTFNGDEFMEAWRLWMTQPKQRAKPVSAHQLTLNRLAKYPEEFATTLVTQAASAGWQGCIFNQTPAQFRAWEAEKTGGQFNKRMSFTDFQNLPTNGEPKF